MSTYTNIDQSHINININIYQSYIHISTNIYIYIYIHIHISNIYKISSTHFSLGSFALRLYMKHLSARSLTSHRELKAQDIHISQLYLVSCPRHMRNQTFGEIPADQKRSTCCKAKGKNSQRPKTFC